MNFLQKFLQSIFTGRDVRAVMQFRERGNRRQALNCPVTMVTLEDYILKRLCNRIGALWCQFCVQWEFVESSGSKQYTRTRFVRYWCWRKQTMKSEDQIHRTREPFETKLKVRTILFSLQSEFISSTTTLRQQARNVRNRILFKERHAICGLGQPGMSVSHNQNERQNHKLFGNKSNNLKLLYSRS
jgi:hypothetical protein